MSTRVVKLRRELWCVFVAASVVACSSAPGQEPLASAEPVQAAQSVVVTVPSTPANVFALAGGDSIALRWDPVSTSNVKFYKVYRNGSTVGGAVPSTTGLALFYFDKVVTRDQTYWYQVQAVDLSGNASPLSRAVSARLSSSGFPVPTITIDDSEAHPSSAVRAFLREGKAFLEVWYPKLVELLATPDHYPSTNVLLKAIHEPLPGEPNYVPFEPKCAGSGWYSGESAVYICDHVSAANSDMGLFGHEATHIIQGSYVNAPGFLWEGAATWAGDFAHGDRRALPDLARTYMNGYGDGAAFLAWVSQRYNKPDLTAKLSRRAMREPFSYAWFKAETGYAVNELWHAMSGVRLSLPAQLDNRGACARTVRDPSDDPKAPLPVLELGPCEPYEHNTFVYELSAKRLHLAALCVGTTEQHEVLYAFCDGSAGQQWDYRNYGWRNVQTGRCLQPRAGRREAGTPLVTAPCDGSASQQWNYLSF